MKALSDVYAIDANVILRYLLRDDESLWRKAHSIMVEVEAGRIAVVCEPVTLAEVVWVLRSTYKLPQDEISARLLVLLVAEGFLMPNKPRYIRALELFADSVRHFGDACVCAAAVEECDGRLLSFDKELSRVQGISRAEEPGATSKRSIR